MKNPNAQATRLHAREFSFCLLLSIDIFMAVCGQVAGFALRFRTPWVEKVIDTQTYGWLDYRGHIIFGTLLFILMAGWHGVYRDVQFLHTRSSLFLMLRVVFLWTLSYLLLTLFTRFQPEISRLYVLVSALMMVPFLLLGRKLIQSLFRSGSLAEGLRQRVVFIGWSEQAEKLTASMEKDRYHPYQVVGCLSVKENSGTSCHDLPVLGSIEEIGVLKEKYGISLAVLADTHSGPVEIGNWCELCAREMVDFKVIPDYFEILLSGLKLESISGVPVLGLEPLPVEFLHHRMIKRVMDIAGALAGLVLGFPFFLLAAACVWQESPGPVFYNQIRSGRKGRNFLMWKLRSMALDAEKEGPGWTRPGDNRVLSCGRWIRRWNIDEIPQFWNVLKGEMSLVGPRPERPEHIETLKHRVRYYNARHAIKPGMTGWAQVNGLRGDTSISDRVQYDLYYAENWSVWLDLYIMVVTLFRRENAY